MSRKRAAGDSLTNKAKRVAKESSSPSAKDGKDAKTSTTAVTQHLDILLRPCPALGFGLGTHLLHIPLAAGRDTTMEQLASSINTEVERLRVKHKSPKDVVIANVLLWADRMFVGLEKNKSPMDRYFDVRIWSVELHVVTPSKDKDKAIVPLLVVHHQRDLVLRLTMENGSTIEQIKDKIELLCAWPASNYRLVWAGKQLEDGRTMTDYNMEGQQLHTLHMLPRLYGGGGGGGFAFNSMRVTERHAWSDKAPEWRVAQHGLSLEGRCTNVKCKAHGEMVLCNMGDQCAVDLQHDTERFTCPCCHERIQPTTCGFNNCAWWWIGEKVDGKGEVLRCDYPNTADDAYTRFSESGGVVPWRRLKLFASPSSSGFFVRDTIQGDCPICLEALMDKQKLTRLACYHLYHESCLAAWTSEHKTCPYCRAPANPMPV